ncbi:carbohydrate ABC transporter permease [Agromyces protaetiae]|uniref:Carbohydrate ABC transporter permease n=1 Tax=Agromyces protaetiae TaxID=2509455 RepID=A0A4P6FDF3_9MICO|nr:carbohydrate ABC transporter permease [Agromyces protaetiae]QAY72389.1 carbohydrate ABC transporter permease [Agromyces protaetiae]
MTTLVERPMGRQQDPDGGEAHVTVTREPVAGRRKSGRSLAESLGRHTVLTVLALFTAFPVLLIVSTALKTPADVRVNPFGLFSSFSFENLATAWTVGRFGEYAWNSVLLSVPTTILVVLLSTAAGYAFARLQFWGRGVLFSLIMLGLLVPFFTYMIPLYFELKTIGLLDTLLGVILVMTTGGLAFGTFFMRSFFLNLPSELEQAARVDGCSEFGIFWRVMLPLVRPGMLALAVFMFLYTWNEFLIPLLYLPGGELRPLTTGLYMFTAGRAIDIGPMAAGTLITILPVLLVFLVLQRQVTQGFLAGAVKG